MTPITRIAAAFALTLGLTASALAQAASISGEVKKIDEGSVGGSGPSRPGTAPEISQPDRLPTTSVNPLLTIYRAKIAGWSRVSSAA